MDVVRSDAVYYRYDRSRNLFVLIYRGNPGYEPTLDGIRNYVAGIGCTDIQNADCNGLSVVQFSD